MIRGNVHPVLTDRLTDTTLTISAILSSPQDPSHHKHTDSVKYKREYIKTGARARAKTLALAMIIALPLFALAQGVAPGLNFSTGTLNERSVVSYNSQTVALLSPLSPLQVNSSRGGGSVEIVDVSALKSSQGTLSEGSANPINRNGSISVYVVKEGDSLSEIANMFNVSTNTIIWANDLDGHTIVPGKTLIILPMSGVRHLIEENDTVDSLARKYKGDADEIRQFNNLSADSTLVVGSFINIPDGEVEEVVSAPPKKVASSSGSWLIAPLRSYVKTQGIHGYNAVDLAAPVGTATMAAAGGTVITAKSDNGWNGGYGHYVVIKHSNGVQTLYAHLSTVLVSEGQQVVQGQVIGYVGMTGKTTGPHIHFEVRGATNPF